MSSAGALELMGMGIALMLDQRQLADPCSGSRRSTGFSAYRYQDFTSEQDQMPQAVWPNGGVFKPREQTTRRFSRTLPPCAGKIETSLALH